METIYCTNNFIERAVNKTRKMEEIYQRKISDGDVRGNEDVRENKDVKGNDDIRGTKVKEIQYNIQTMVVTHTL